MLVTKRKITQNMSIDHNGEQYDLGKLVTTTLGYCAASKKHIPSFKCIETGKTFTDVNKLSRHLAILLKNK